MVPQGRLELPRLSALASKTSMATITSPAQFCTTLFQYYSNLPIFCLPLNCVVFLQHVAILLTGSRGQTRTDDWHRMKVLHWPLCYSTVNL